MSCGGLRVAVPYPTPTPPPPTDCIDSIFIVIFFLFQSSKGVFDQFPNFLSSATKDNPLIIILDSLDQLSPLHGSWKLIWFPRQLPLHVKFIVSTLPDQEYKCFPILKVSLSGN